MKQLLLFCLFSLCVFSLEAQKIPSSHSSTVLTIHKHLNRQPQFLGGMNELSKFLNKNIKWPSKEMDIDVQGRVIISFIVEKDGSLSHFKVDRKVGPEFDEEALRVLRKMPKWNPAILKGKPVRCKYSLPINFTVSA